MSSTSAPILYWNLVHGYPKWVYTPLFFLVLLITIQILVHRTNRSSNNHHGTTDQLLRYGFWSSLAVSFWTCGIIAALAIWIDTIYHVHNKNNYATGLCILFAAAIAVLTFMLEGLETAFTELRNKESQQLEDPAAARAFSFIQEMGEHTFFEAREWAIIVLLIWATFLIEQRAYYLPYMGKVDEHHMPALTAIRITLTLALTAFALVWVAQSPAKSLARRNSVEFLSFATRIPFIPLKPLRGVWNILCRIGLQYPSQFVNAIILNVLPRFKTSRKLLPSEFSFFADSLKKYGYGILISDDNLEVALDGKIAARSRTLHYIGDSRESIVRQHFLEKGIADGVQRSLESNSPEASRFWAFEGPIVGEKVDQGVLDVWASLFYTDDPTSTRLPGFSPYNSESFATYARITDKEEDDLAEIVIELTFREQLPRPRQAEEPQRALFVLWETTVMSNPGAFKLPNAENTRTTYPYFKRHSYPCLRSTLTVTLPEVGGDIEKYVFVSPGDATHFTVTYDSAPHERETLRFIEQKRSPEFAARHKKAPARIVGQGLSDQFVCFIDSTLPAAKYCIELLVECVTPKHPA